jgi:hypothetical protein
MKRMIIVMALFVFGMVLPCQGQIPYGVEFRVNTYTNATQNNAKIAALSAGNFVICWTSNGQDGSGYGIFGQVFSGNGEKIGNEFQANTYVGGNQTDAVIASLSNGNFVICWNSDGEVWFSFNIFGQLFSSNAEKIGNEFQVNSYTMGNQPDKKIAPLSDGRFIVCWESNGIFGQLVSANAEKIGKQFLMSTYSVSTRNTSEIASLSNGNFAICWQDYSQNDDEIFGQLFSANAEKIGDEIHMNTYTKGYQGEPVIVSLSGGNFFICWESSEQDGSGAGIFGQLFSATGEKIGSEFRINNYTYGDQISPKIAILSDSTFVLCWLNSEQEGYKIFGQRFSINGEKIGTELQVNTVAHSGPSWPAEITQLSNSHFVICWCVREQNTRGIFGQLFSADAQKTGTEFCLNTFPDNFYFSPEIVPLSDGGFLDCWQGYSQYLVDIDVFAKRFPAEPLHHHLKAFALLEPINDASLETFNPTLAWQQPSEQIVCYPWELQYKIFYADNPDFSSPDTVSVDGDTTVTLPNLQPGTTYFWKVCAKNVNRDSLWSSNTNAFFIRRDATEVEHKATSQPSQFVLQQNYPNPFNPTTTISYELPNPGLVSVKVYGLTGRLVKVLLSGSQAAGAQSVTWDGTDFNGNPVAAGIYIYQIEFTGEDGKKQVQSRKMSLVK